MTSPGRCVVPVSLTTKRDTSSNFFLVASASPLMASPSIVVARDLQDCVSTVATTRRTSYRPPLRYPGRIL